MPIAVGVVSLGCAKNLIDTEIMLGLLKEAGFVITADEGQADLLIVNTCAFIQEAKEESISNILEVAKYKESGKCRALIVCGCLAQRYPRELYREMPEIDALVGTGAVNKILQVVRRVLNGNRVIEVDSPGYVYSGVMPRVQSTPCYTAFLKIAEGCSNFCSYCIIPRVRGPYRSRPMDAIEKEARILVKRGVRELILVAQDTTMYGKDLYGEYRLAGLLRRLAKIEDLQWLRLYYCYPEHIKENLIETIASEPKICKYLDIPLQHANDVILKRMGRKTSKKEIIELINHIRAAIPGLTLRTSFIVGFPGEKERDFEELLAFMSEMKFERVGIFKYSREEGTPAAGLGGQVPASIKKKRYERAMKLQQNISYLKNVDKVGKKITILVEGKAGKKKNLYVGRSESDGPEVDGRVFFASRRTLLPGEFVDVLISAPGAYDLFGEIVPGIS